MAASLMNNRTGNALATRAAKRLGTATPSAPAENAPQALEPAAAVPSRDPGPPPKMPFFTGNHVNTAVDLMIRAAEQRDRDAILAVNTFRQPPQVPVYRAELLAWLDAMDAYDASK